MIPSRFNYHRPADAAQAAQLLAEDPAYARVLGGGTWLVPEMSRGEARPSAVVDLASAGLDRIELHDGELRLGAMVTYAALLRSAEVARHAPMLRLAAASITGGQTIRNQGTIGGSVAAARPSSDLPGVLVALEATAIVQGPRAERRLPVAELIDGAMSTALGHDELIAGFAVPTTDARAGTGYVKLKRGASSWPILCASALVSVRDGVCASARLVLGGAAATPVVVDVSEPLVGQPPDAATITAASARAAEAITEWWDDALAPADYRAATAAPIARRALVMAFENEARGA